jgi:hypothetical protein
MMPGKISRLHFNPKKYPVKPQELKPKKAKPPKVSADTGPWIKISPSFWKKIPNLLKNFDEPFKPQSTNAALAKALSVPSKP